MSAAPSIFTLTGNLLCERTLDFADWSIGKTQRASRESFQVGGKGINVAKMLQRLDAKPTALCFTGGATGAECEAWLREQKFAHRAFPCVRANRVGIVIRSGQHPETTFFSPDVAPDAAAIRACVGFLDAQPAGQVLAFCGSFPGWDSGDVEPLRAALTRWLARGILAADSYGPPLAWLVAQPLALVKINATELRTLFPDESATTSTATLLASAAQRWPTRNWIVTDGGGPLWMCEAGAHPTSIKPPSVKEVSPTGSGDVLFASVLDSLYRRQRSLTEAVTTAIPLASANAAHPGIAEFPM